MFIRHRKPSTLNGQSIYLLFCLLVLLIFPCRALSTPLVRLSTSERIPYIGKDLPEKGYVNELVTQVFKRAGYTVKLNFAPLARAINEAKYAKVDGVVPYHYNKNKDNLFAYSRPFPGDNIGLLKKKSLIVSIDLNQPLNEIFKRLKKYTFGVLRGDTTVKEFDDSGFLKKDYATSHLNNIDKLWANRIDFIVIDKYTAADLMVSKRPHMIGELEFIELPNAKKNFHIAFSKKKAGYKKLKSDFDNALKHMMEDGSTERILNRHGIFKPKDIAGKNVKLTIGTVSNADMLIMQSLAGQFEKQHPHIELQWRVLDENTLRLRLMSDLAVSDGQFDVMTIGAYETPIWAKRGWLYPISDLPGAYEANDIIKPVRDSLSVSDKLYAVPFYAESSMTYYRKDLFEKKGLSMPQQPVYEDILRFAKTIHDPDQKIYGICLRGKPGWGENMCVITTMLNTYGGRWFDENWKPCLATPEWEEMLKSYVNLLKNYGPPNPGENGFSENLKLFSDGRCAMWIDATVAAGMLFNPKQSNVHDKLGFAPAPIARTPKGSHWLWTWALAVPSSSNVKKEAIEFITWATSKAYIELVAENHGWVAVPPGTRVSTYENKHYSDVAPFAGFVFNAIQKADPNNATLKPVPYAGIGFVNIPEFPAIGHQVGLKIASILDGRLTIKKALTESQKLVEAQMVKSGY